MTWRPQKGSIVRSLRSVALHALVWLSLTTSAAVQVELINPEPKKNSNNWPDTSVFEYSQPAFAFHRLPQAYTEDGLRDEWPNPLLVRAKDKIFLPEGEHQFLLRSRRAARLYINGELIAETPFPPKIRDGHDSVERPFIPLGPEVRFPAPGDQEKLVRFRAKEGPHHIQLEFFVGGYAGSKPMRPETGETLVAVSFFRDKAFYLLSRDPRIPLTDAAWEAYQSNRNRELDRMDHDRRRKRQASEDDYWERRHEFARAVVGAAKVPSAAGTIDRLIKDRMDTANLSIDSTPQARHFREIVQPLLADRCLPCHGPKAKGGLVLDSLASARAGGDSGEPAIVPNDPNQSLLVELITSTDEEDRMPPKGEPLSVQEVRAVRRWIQEGAVWPETSLTKPIKPSPPTEDWQFLRRVHLDTVGVPPSPQTIRQFLTDNKPDKRKRLIDMLLDDTRWADHWTGYWQDVLAENPTIVNPTLNNTGPFRWWIYESFSDNKPMDRFVTELVMMGGSLQNGGPKGFEMASQNDVPMAAKANILTTAFLATEMKCSRCHDAPFHDNTQQDLFGLAAMLAQKPLAVPASSSVPQDKLHTGGRQPLIQVTLQPGTLVEPAWAFPEWAARTDHEAWIKDAKSSRERLALNITSPHNSRFAEVLVNRLWQRLLGRGIVEPVDDWENATPSNPELLTFLAREFVRNGFDLKHVARLILNSETYQRQTSQDPDSIRFFTAPGPRRLSAEQIVDSLFSATQKAMRTEPLTVDIGGGRPWSNALNLGRPTRAWMFGGMANNRDRPSLILPRAQAVIDVLTQFGWRPSRQEPTSYRQSPLSPLQPAALNNGIMTTWLTRLSDDHGFTQLALRSLTLDELVSELYLSILSRQPTPTEASHTIAVLKPGYESRVVPKAKPHQPSRPEAPPQFVTWANHLHPEATGIQLEEARKARIGAPVTPRLQPKWRARMEDVIWVLINLPEAIHYP